MSDLNGFEERKQDLPDGGEGNSVSEPSADEQNPKEEKKPENYTYEYSEEEHTSPAREVPPLGEERKNFTKEPPRPAGNFEQSPPYGSFPRGEQPNGQLVPPQSQGGWQSPPQNAGAYPPPPPPQQTQWTFNDYGPIGGDTRPPKPPKQKREKKQKPDSGKSNQGIKVLAIVMSALFLITTAGFIGYVIYDQSNNANVLKPDASSDFEGGNQTTPGLDIQDRPDKGDTAPGNQPQISGEKMPASDIHAAVEPTVVGVVGYVKAKTGVYQVASQGSGVVFSEDGYIITNRHVIKNETMDTDFDRVEVIYTTGESYIAEIKGSDKETDLAVLKIEATGLKTAVFGNSDDVKVGDKAFVIGNPNGLVYAGSLTGGYISAVHREVFMESIGTNVEYIQTDAAINPGNSGGALVNEYGQVIGITSAKFVAEEYEGMGFAIPINNVKPIIESIVNNGYVTGRVKIGINYKVVGEALAELNDIPQGLRVHSIEDYSDAKNKGLLPGDIIYKMDGQDVPDTPQVKEILKNKKPGDTIVLSVYRVDVDTRKATTFEIEVALVESTERTD